jgi:3-oxoacyl-[acyl-carrier-protein] synthase-3
MIVNQFKGIKVDGVSCAVPNEWKSIESLKDGENNEVLDRFVKNTTIEGHYEVGERQTSSDLCFVAAQKLIEQKQIDREQIGILIHVTQTPDYICPSTACVLQDRLGLSKDCIAFDVNLGCSGYPYGLNIAASLMTTSNVEYALVLAGDASTKHNVRTDNSRLLFGDSGTATLLKKKENVPEMSMASKTDGSGLRYMWRPYGHSRHHVLKDEGVHDEIETFNFAINEAPDIINRFLESRNETSEDYDYLVLHQANMMIMKQIAKRTGFPKTKMLTSIDHFSNTSNGSIPTTIVHCLTKEEKSKCRLLICGYGIGLSWAVGSMTVDTKDILPLLHSDDYFDDGLY